MAVQHQYTSILMNNLEVVGTGTTLAEDGRPAIVVNGASNDRRPVALLFANPISTVLSRFGVTVDGN